MVQLYEIFDICSFEVVKRTAAGPPRWWNQQCGLANQQKKLAHKNLSRTYSAFNLFCYKQACGSFRHVCRLAERGYYRQLFLKSRVGSKEFYKLVRRHKSKDRIMGGVVYNSPYNEVISHSEALAARWNSPILSPPPPSDTPPPCFSLPDISSAISALSNSAPGRDGITRHCILTLFCHNSESFCSLINALIGENYFHSEWLHANVVLIPRKDGSERPICVTLC